MLRVLVISDTHVGSRWGLFPDKFRLSTGAKYTPNKGQRYLLRCWRAMQDDLAGDIDILILNGDIINGPNPKENARDQIEQDPDWQVRAAVELLTPLVARAGQVYATQGSPYHAGEGAQWDEAVAHALGAVPDEAGHQAWDWLLLDVEGVLLDVAHHQSVVMRYVTMPLEREQQFDQMIAAHKGGSADLIIRSHAHRYVEANVELQRSVATAAWQLQTRYARRGRWPKRWFSRYIGGLLVEVYPGRKREHTYCTELRPLLYPHPRLTRRRYVKAEP